MNYSSFVSPIETVELISIVSHLSIISNFLYTRNELSETDLYKPIPVVNALYQYLVDTDKNTKYITNYRKLKVLIKELIAGTDLYGARKEESLDRKFVETMLNYIISSLVFEKYGNIFGFFAEVVRLSDNTDIQDIRVNFITALKQEKFINEYGPDSQLEELSILKIFIDLILPLFPVAQDNHMSIFSIDYMYAQAGSMFLRSLDTKPNIGPTSDEEFIAKFSFNKDAHFDEYIRLAHILEQLVLTKVVKKTALRMFALPALLHYVYKEKYNILNETIIDIINSENHWEKAFNLLFSNINTVFEETDKVRNNNCRHQFLLALLKFKNRTAIARESLKMKCTILDEDFEDKVDDYLKETGSFSCVNGNKIQVLPSVNILLKNQNDLIAQKYYDYEKESIQRLFIDKGINISSLSKSEVRKGLICNLYNGGGMFDVSELQMIQESDDLLEIYNSSSEKYIYFALIRRNYTVYLIEEANDPVSFRKKLGLYDYEKFRHFQFNTKLKDTDEPFEILFSRIADYRKFNLRRKLDLMEHEEIKKTWWKEMLLSIIPFYTCIQAIHEDNTELAVFSCSVDSLFFISGVLEMSLAVKVIFESIQDFSLLSAKSALFRTSVRAVIMEGEKVLAKEEIKFSNLLTTEMFKTLGIGIFRLVDPGFELAYTLGSKALKSLHQLVFAVNKKYVGSFKLSNTIVKTAEDKVGFALMGKKIDKHIYVQSFKNKRNSGYGYKFIRLPNGKTAEFRSVREFQKPVPVVFVRVNEKFEKVYQEVDFRTGELIQKDLNIEYKIKSDFSRPKSYGIEVESVLDRKLCIGIGNVVYKRRRRRSPGCRRSDLGKAKKNLEHMAVNFAIKKKGLTEELIRSELKKRLFLEGEKTELDFVKELRVENYELKVPDWSEEIKVENRELLDNLRYKDSFENPNPTVEETSHEDWSIYSDHAYLSTTFEDYNAILYYTHEGYEGILGITGSSASAKTMREAMYRLAIRQSDDDISEYAFKLYRGEGSTDNLIEKMFYPAGKEIVLQKFLSTSELEDVALEFSYNAKPPKLKMLYEIQFSKPYLRAKIKKILSDYEEEIILLPGTRFRVKSVVKGLEDEANSVKVVLTHVPEKKSKSIINVMHELKKLNEVGSKPYSYIHWVDHIPKRADP